ncbi:hypothetical protein [Bradyrhizobium sp. STM 3562]|uniref:hypothetical protein n=1 Tax=Bradyrhizobium sp. STM 3562 TaxID=578924 RepID=UPI003890CC1A
MQLSVKEQDARTAERARKLVDKAVAALFNPAPDTFLGRKTQELFPKENDE